MKYHSLILSKIIHENLCQFYDNLPKSVTVVLEIKFEQFDGE